MFNLPANIIMPNDEEMGIFNEILKTSRQKEVIH
jgi:hypothetical protein